MFTTLNEHASSNLKKPERNQVAVMAARGHGHDMMTLVCQMDVPHACKARYCFPHYLCSERASIVIDFLPCQASALPSQLACLQLSADL